MNRLPFYLEITILQPLTQIMTKTVYIPLTAISNSNVSFGFNSLYLCHVGFDVFIEDTSPVPSHLLDPYTYRLSRLLPSRHGNEFPCLPQRPLRITIATWLSGFFVLFYSFTCMCVLPTCVSMHRLHAQHPAEVRRGHWISRTSITDDCALSRGC